jgi:fused signal recognition particle receptor
MFFWKKKSQIISSSPANENLVDNEIQESAKDIQNNKENAAKISKLSQNIFSIFSNKKLDQSLIDELEDQLIMSDLGVNASNKIVSEIRNKKFAQNIEISEIKKIISEVILKIVKPCQISLEQKLINNNKKTKIIIFCGVNGAGKTTTIGKIADNLSKNNQKVIIAACDTFRAAATEQLEIWAKKANCEIIAAVKEGEDPASVAYRAAKNAVDNNYDVLLIDTAGRLQNKQNLMDELKKIISVIKKIDATSPDESILIIDANIGQNANQQLEIFDKTISISGLIITKLDGSAKGGVVVNICDKYQKPIYAVGVGEKISDLKEFNAEEFVNNLI